MVDGRDALRCHQGRWKVWWKLTMIFATGFLVDFCRLRPAFRGRQETARFPSGPASAPITPPASSPTHFASERRSRVRLTECVILKQRASKAR